MRVFLAPIIFIVAIALLADTTEAIELSNNGELLNNGDFEMGETAWTITEVPNSSDDIVRLPFAFANHTSGGQQGVWASAFYGAVIFFEIDPVSGIVSQTVDAVAGGSYSFSGWTKFESNYSGGVDTIDPASISFLAGMPSPTETFIALEFLDSNGVALNPIIGIDPNGVSIIDPSSPNLIDLKTERQILCGGNANDQTCGTMGPGGLAGWTQHTRTGIIAPPGTASARLTAGMIDGVFNLDPGQSVFLDDFSLISIPEPTSVMLSVIALILGMSSRKLQQAG